MNNFCIKRIMNKYPIKLTRSRAIRIYCKEICSSGDQKSWKECSFFQCPLYRFRTGKEKLVRGKPIKISLNEKKHKLHIDFSKNDVSDKGVKV